MRITIEISDEIVEKAAKSWMIDKTEFIELHKERIEKLVTFYFDKELGIVSEEEFESYKETLYLESIPGMKQKIIKGLNTPLSECLKIEW